MSRLGIAVASAALLVSTSAFAQIGDITGMPTGSSVQFSSSGNFDSKNPPAAGTISGTGNTCDGGCSRWQTDVDIGETQISFKAANVTTGGSQATTGTTTVAFDFHNPAFDVLDSGPGSVNFESTIIAAGMGFQLISPGGRTGGGCSFYACSPITNPDYNFDSFGFPAEATFTIGQVGFNFDIADNGVSLYNVNGQLDIKVNGSGVFFDYDSLFGEGSADDLLNGFRMIGDEDGQYFGFEWDETHVHLDLFGADHSLTYTTSVFSYTDTGCIAGGSICMVGYSGFGDPIGRGGGADALRAAGFGAFDSADSAIPGGATFNLPTFDGRTVRFQSVTDNGVPEPATWAVMILGFAAVGATLRRRRMVGAQA